MVIDTSAVVAILMDEPEQNIFKQIVAADTNSAMPAMTFYETSIVMAAKKRTQAAARLVDDFVRDLAIDVVVAAVDDVVAAREAYFRYGRGYHPAGLNLADCFAYALAKTRNEPLLFKGDDFSKTDIVPAWRRGGPS
jgi:ribonuclease VapC